MTFFGSTQQILVQKTERVFVLLDPFITQHTASLNTVEMWNIYRCFISYLTGRKHKVYIEGNINEKEWSNII